MQLYKLIRLFSFKGNNEDDDDDDDGKCHKCIIFINFIFYKIYLNFGVLLQLFGKKYTISHFYRYSMKKIIGII